MIEIFLFLRRSTEREAKMWMLVVNLVAPRKIKLTDLNLDPKAVLYGFLNLPSRAAGSKFSHMQ